MKSDHTLELGYWLSLLVLLLGLAYLGLVIAALASGSFPPVGLCQTLMNVVILLTIPCLVLLWVIVHQVTPAEKQAFSLGSLVLMTIFATFASINRYNALTVVLQATAMGKSEGLEWFLPYGWPSIMAAMEVLAWGFYYGLACLCLAPVFGKNRLEKTIFWTLIASGGLSFFAVLGQVLNSVPLSALGILAWGPGAILLMVLWAQWFKKQESR
jgi:hypothetical protein